MNFMNNEFSIIAIHIKFNKKKSSDPSHKVDGKAAVDSWYDEIKLYTFGAEPKVSGTGHFTQVVWKNSKLLGVGVSRNQKNQTFVVCNYDPPGNYVGQHAENVLKI
jgi:glioma pathogenesis-related protein 2